MFNCWIFIFKIATVCDEGRNFLRLLKQAISNITGELDEIIGLDYDDEIDHSEISIINCSLPQ